MEKTLIICDVVQFYSTLSGGVRRYIHEKIDFILENTPHSHCLVIPSHRDAVTRTERTTVYEIKSPKLIGSASYRILLRKKQILSAVQEIMPDIIEVGDPYRAAWIGQAAAELINVPIVAFYHSDYPRALDRTLRKYLGKTIESLISPLIRKYLIRLYNRMSATIVSSTRCHDTLKSIGINKLHTIPLGTNLKTFSPRNSHDRILKELGLPENSRLLLFVGRLAREKNIGSLFEMMEILKKDERPHHLLLVGDGEWQDRVRLKAKEEHNIHWIHFCESPERLADLYSAADLFVHAGDCETFGLVSLEAQACGTRVLGVKDGGLDQGLKYESPLIMARNTSGQALADALHQIWEVGEGQPERDLRRKNMETYYSWNTTFTKITRLYSELSKKNLSANSPKDSDAHELEDSPLRTHR